MPNTLPLPEIICEDFSVESDTVGVSLHVRRKRMSSRNIFDADQTIVLVHGATFSSSSLFDVPLEAGSFMDLLASRGFDVYAVDIRGYGRSDRPPEMREPAENADPIAPIGVALRDLGCAVEAVRKRAAVSHLCLVGMSWGGSIAGAYAAADNGAISKLVLIAPLWLLDAPARIDAGGNIGAYRTIDVRAFHGRWIGPAPEAKRHDLIPAGWFEKWVETTLATDPESGGSGTIRAPSGALLDIRKHWTAGNAYYDPASIKVPVLLVHAEWDADTPINSAMDLFSRLVAAPYRRWVEIGEGTHMVVLEKNRWQVIEAIAGFAGERHQPEIL